MSSSLNVYTAFASYTAPDRLDIARLSAVEGEAFAPSWALLNPFLEKRKGSGLTPADWSAYRLLYMEEMRLSFLRKKRDWARLLSRVEVTLTCYCKGAEQCHRTILGAEILPKLGAVFLGERQDTIQGSLF